MSDPLLQKYDTVYEKLVPAYGMPTWRQHLPPVDELVSTILSQSTSDTNRDKGFDALKAHYPDWFSVMNAPEAEVIETIRPAGLANQKGPRIQAALRTVYEQRGAISLDFLADMPLNEAADWLTHIKGVGPKTAAIILLFAFGRPAFPVDTHVHRITQRLGLIGPHVSAEKAHKIFAQLDRPQTFYAMHLNLIRHGREVCRARSPRCEICPLQTECNYFQHEP
ncbi:MAG: endonuclease III [Ardenticatenaceae bacterium]|nr:endonuclease III [Anaerolineales bacterium]MCB8922382.1 endonuclease III [Ardenticatenaceae bacterium]MCB8991314.1 endonuclease III [Ardenticatenaceae bacterium]